MRRRYSSPATNSLLHRLQIRWTGWKHGKKGIPTGDDVSDFEEELLDRGTRHLEQIKESYSRKIQGIEGQRQEKYNRYAQLVEQFLEENARYKAKKEELQRDVRIHLSHRLYMVFAGLIVGGEFALNSQAFEVFQKPTILTWVMALVVAVGIPGVAHFTGIWIKQWPKPAWVTGIKVAVSIGGVFGCLVGLNWARRQYLLWLGIAVAEDAHILEQSFLMINMFVFMAATMMSYFAHDEDQELYNLHKETNRLREKALRLDSDIHRHGAQLDRFRSERMHRLNEVRAMMAELIRLYRRWNMSHRTNGVRPQAFNRNPDLRELEVESEIQQAVSEKDIDELRKRFRGAARQVLPST